ncbi:hypothetical protein AC578_7448 [Pseudocercospora eumusae]|uniref:Uncharacterized protein n=1 Tax=Pseudocercospora eumusae TaxID=321146 RepID=A0A139H986_9PEZI|nr:hypothetical protein AC578_7448 [Pseudocercospora eumusae]
MDDGAEPSTSDRPGAQESAPFESTSPLTSPLTSLPSSPIPFHPKSEVMAGKQPMGPPSKPDAASKRKRSRDVDELEPEASPTASAGDSQLAPESKNTEDSIDSASNAMPDPQSGGPAQRAQKSKSKTTKKKKAERKKQVEQDVSDEPDEAVDDSQHDSEDSDSAGEALPEVALPGFDWNDLQQRFRVRMDELNREENKALQDFNRLIGVRFFVFLAEGHSSWLTVCSISASGPMLDVAKNSIVAPSASELISSTFSTKKSNSRRSDYIISRSSTPSRVRWLFSKISRHRVTFSLAVGVLLTEPDWAKDIVPDRRRMSNLQASIDPSEGSQPTPAQRSRTTPLLQLEDWSKRVAGDIDMQFYERADFHVTRCTIL